MSPLTAILARSDDGVIGIMGPKGPCLPWRLGPDLKRFRELTTGHAVIMGRKTFDSMGRKPLQKRHNIEDGVGRVRVGAYRLPLSLGWHQRTQGPEREQSIRLGLVLQESVMSRIRWIEECRGRWGATFYGHALEVFSTGLGDVAWQVYDPRAEDPSLSIVSGDAPTLADAKWWAERAARSAFLHRALKVLGPEEFDRRLRAELDAAAEARG